MTSRTGSAFRARPLPPGRRLAALVAGVVLLLAAAAPLVGYLLRSGPDWLVGYAGLVVVLAAVMLGVGASGTPQRWRVLGVVSALLCLFSFVPLGIGQFGAADSGALLFLAGLLLVPVAPLVALVGRPRG